MKPKVKKQLFAVTYLGPYKSDMPDEYEIPDYWENFTATICRNKI